MTNTTSRLKKCQKHCHHFFPSWVGLDCSHNRTPSKTICWKNINEVGVRKWYVPFIIRFCRYLFEVKWIECLPCFSNASISSFSTLVSWIRFCNISVFPSYQIILVAEIITKTIFIVLLLNNRISEFLKPLSTHLCQ